MESYYVNKNAQENGDHEVHVEGCNYIPLPHNRKYLGMYSNCMGVVREAQKTYPTSNGCYYCCKPCQ